MIIQAQPGYYALSEVRGGAPGFALSAERHAIIAWDITEEGVTAITLNKTACVLAMQEPIGTVTDENGKKYQDIKAWTDMRQVEYDKSRVEPTPAPTEAPESPPTNPEGEPDA